jgi:hypothetical protein
VAVSDGTKCTDLNADQVDGYHVSDDGAAAGERQTLDDRYVNTAEPDAMTASNNSGPILEVTNDGSSHGMRVYSGTGSSTWGIYSEGRGAGGGVAGIGTGWHGVLGQCLHDFDDHAGVFASNTGGGWALVADEKSKFQGQIHSTVTTGTAPFNVASTTVNTNLNADQVDGYDAGNASGQVAVSNGTECIDLNADQVDGYDAGNASGQVAVSDGTLCTDLNADKVDGSHGCTTIVYTGYEDSGDFETGSTETLGGGFPKGCTIRLISTKSSSGGSTAMDGMSFGFYNQNWYAVDGGWMVVAMSSDSSSVQTATGVNGNTTSTTILQAGSCTLKDDTASLPSQTTWVVTDNSTTYSCIVYVCD